MGWSQVLAREYLSVGSDGFSTFYVLQQAETQFVFKQPAAHDTQDVAMAARLLAQGACTCLLCAASVLGVNLQAQQPMRTAQPSEGPQPERQTSG